MNVLLGVQAWFCGPQPIALLGWHGEFRTAEPAEENPSYWHWFEGNFEAYEANKIERLGPDAAKPHRSTYRKLTRD